MNFLRYGKLDNNTLRFCKYCLPNTVSFVVISISSKLFEVSDWDDSLCNAYMTINSLWLWWEVKKIIRITVYQFEFHTLWKLRYQIHFSFLTLPALTNAIAIKIRKMSPTSLSIITIMQNQSFTLGYKYGIILF